MERAGFAGRLRAAVVAAALAFALAGSSAQPSDAEGADSADVVVLLDVSQSVLPFFQDVTDYVVGSVIRDYLRFGDTFHLLSFGEATRPEIVEKMRSEGDVKSALARLYLLYPLARYSDLLGALEYLHQYAAALPESRRKVLVVISDGISNPPPASPNARLGAAELSGAIEQTAARIRAKGWQAHFIALPFDLAAEAAEAGVRVSVATPSAPGSVSAGAKDGAASASTGRQTEAGRTGPAAAGAAAAGPGAAAGSAAAASATAAAYPGSSVEPAGSPAKRAESYLETAAKASGTEVTQFTPETKENTARNSLALPRLEFPGPLGRRGYSLAFPIKVHNDSASELNLELESARSGSSEILARRSFLTLAPGASGSMEVAVDLPLDLPEGRQALEIELLFANGIRSDPSSGTLDLELRRTPLAGLFRSGGKIALFAAIFVVGTTGILALLLTARRAAKRSSAPVVAAVLQSGASAAGAGQGSATRSDSSAAPQTRESAAADRRPAAPVGLAEETALPARSSPAALTAASSAAPSAPRAGEPPARHAAAAAEDEHASRIEQDVRSLAADRKAEAARNAALLAAAAQGAARSRAPDGAASKKADAAGGPVGAERAQGPRRRMERPPVVKPGALHVELLVEDQNPHVGSRNVHLLRAGEARTVGGGRSDFLVFLVKVPPRSAELAFDGERLSLKPLRPELFPEVGESVEDCLDRPIPMRSRQGYPLVLRFRRYERPADRINRLLHCIEAPGLFTPEGEA